MAARTATRQAASASSSPAPPRRSLAVPQPASTASPQLQELRRQWKWAAVGQFFYTFAQLIALDDVSLVDVEEDLVNSTMIVIPRLMQRLLLTLTQDRKITVDNWQTALRRQYLRRDPDANPIGIEPIVSRNSRAATVETDIKSEEHDSVLPDDALATDGDKGKASTNEHDAEDITEHDPDRKSAVVELNDTKAKDTRHDVARKEEAEVSESPQSLAKDWASLEMLEKLEGIHVVIEWHFQNPLRLRSIMRSDDENASWRIEPIGYDSKRNAYWLIGTDRLWMQRVPPKPPKKSTKRKAVSNADTHKTKIARVEKTAKGKKAKEKVSSETAAPSKSVITKSKATPQRPKRGSHPPPEESGPFISSPGSSGRARAAKTQANVKLDLQAKQLAAAKAEMEALNCKSTARNSPTKSSNRRTTLGIRISRRLRGGGDDDDDDEWQPIPEEWLPQSEKTESQAPNPTANGPPTRKSTRETRTKPKRKAPAPRVVNTRPPEEPRMAGLESDDESDLTELSDSEESTQRKEVDDVPEFAKPNGVAHEHENDEVTYQPPAEAEQIPGFVEWETICVSLQEWEEISHRFEKATHYLEKALHKILVQEVVPYVTESLRELERQRQKEDALMNRKRSSRLAVREMEKEAARLEATRIAEENEKMARLRRLEAREKREEEERLKRELEREQRRKEREERELARHRRLEHGSVETEVDVVSEPQASEAAANAANSSNAVKPKPPRHRPSKKVSKQSGESENWELECEICGSKGINRDEDVPLMSCGKCNKWQHITCHDAIDRKAGRPLRDWDTVDFFCKRCRALQNGKRSSSHGVPSSHVPSGREHVPDKQPVDRCSSAGLTNGYGVQLATSSVRTPYQQPPGQTSFAGFTHYQPHQRGFSPLPSVPYHPPPVTSTHPSILPQASMSHGDLRGWDPQARTSPSAGHAPERNVPTQPSQTIQLGPANVPASYNHQPCGAGLDGALAHGPTQVVQYPHAYFPPQQRVYSNPASSSHHPHP